MYIDTDVDISQDIGTSVLDSANDKETDGMSVSCNCVFVYSFRVLLEWAVLAMNLVWVVRRILLESGSGQ